MNIPDFAINLGNGIYIDSSGRMTTSVPDNIPTFSPAHGLPIPKEAMQDVFGAAKTVLPQLEMVGKVLEIKNADFFKALGLTPELINTFAQTLGIASTVA